MPFRARTADCETCTPEGERNASAFNSVVFPAPELPSTASISPGYAIPDILFNNCLRGTGTFWFCPKHRLTLSVNPELGADGCGASPNTSMFVHE